LKVSDKTPKNDNQQELLMINIVKRQDTVRALSLSFFLLITYPAAAQDTEDTKEPEQDKKELLEKESCAPNFMTNARLQSIIAGIDKEYRGDLGYWQFNAQDTIATVITDERANRMRVVVQVGPAENVDEELLYRMMQANFDTALDARYAITNGNIFSTFIHPLAELSDAQFISGVAQSIALAHSFGDSYNSGALRFGGGDSAATEQELYERIIEQFNSLGESI